MNFNNGLWRWKQSHQNAGLWPIKSLITDILINSSPNSYLLGVCSSSKYIWERYRIYSRQSFQIFGTLYTSRQCAVCSVQCAVWVEDIRSHIQILKEWLDTIYKSLVGDNINYDGLFNFYLIACDLSRAGGTRRSFRSTFRPVLCWNKHFWKWNNITNILVNLRPLFENISTSCTFVGEQTTARHVLSGCVTSLRQGQLQYIWRHNCVLKAIKD